MSLPPDLLDRLCPLHAHIDAAGTVTGAGPTLRKIVGGAPEGRALLDLLTVQRPVGIATAEALLAMTGRRLRFRLRAPPDTPFVGQLVPDGAGGAVLDLSFGIAVAAAVHDHALTSSDFAPTDLAVDLLFLLEAQSAAMHSARRLNARLQEAKTAAETRAATDPLTGLGNRNAAETALARLCAGGGGFGLMHVDLDRFKLVNDSHGHAAGDAVLKAVSRRLRATLRGIDLAARVGGDEFVVILPGLTDRPQLAAVANRLLAATAEPVATPAVTCTISASIGVAAAPAGACGDPAAILAAADGALYTAKRAGRNRMAMAATSPEGRAETTERAGPEHREICTGGS